MPLTEADWTRLGAMLDARLLDVGKPNAWTDDKVAEVTIKSLGRIEKALARIEGVDEPVEEGTPSA